MTKKYTMSMYASKEDLEADIQKDKAAAFDWLSDNVSTSNLPDEAMDDASLIIMWDFCKSAGFDLLEAVQNAISHEGLNEIAAIGQEIDNNGECK